MAEPQGFKTLTPAAAELVGVGSHTIRNWCDWHTDHLLPGANPGPGGQCRLTVLDIEVFKTVHSFRLKGLKTEQINEELGRLTFTEIDDSTDSLAIAVVDLPEKPQTTLAPVVGKITL